MTVAWVNPKLPVQKSHYYCSVCLLEFGWRDGDSGYYEKVDLNDYCGRIFYCCSEVCHQHAQQSGQLEKWANKKTKNRSKDFNK